MGVLESIAGIAAGVVALVGLGYKIYNGIKNSAIKKHIQDGRDLEKRIHEAKTNEERADLVRLLDKHNSK